MALRVSETQMSMAKPAEMATDKAREIKNQAVNPAIMEHEETVESEREMNRTQAMERTEHNRVNADGRNPGGQGETPEFTAREETDETPKSELEQLKLSAAERLLSLPVDIGKYARREEHRIDISL